MPASTQLVLFITIGGGQDVSREEVIMKTTQSLITLHEQYGLEALHETGNGIANVIEEQLNYNANDKSNWYYDSIPGLSTWQKYVVMYSYTLQPWHRENNSCRNWFGFR